MSPMITVSTHPQESSRHSGAAFLVRTRKDVLEADASVTPTVAVIIADNEYDLFWAIDQIGNPYEFEFAEAEVGESVWTAVDVARKGEIDEDIDGEPLEFTQIWSPQECRPDQSGISEGMLSIYRCNNRKWTPMTREMAYRQQTENATSIEAWATFAHLKAVYDSMTDQERQALSEWEDEHVTGDGTYSSTDWPGWIDARARYEQREH